jgi:hypothetical protein
MAGLLSEMFQPTGLLIPLIGLLATLAAFWLGWRMLSPSNEPRVDIPDEAEFLKGVTLERRAALRRRGNTVQVALGYPDQEATFPGWVIDRSQGGLCLLVENEIAPGTVMRVRPRTSSEPTQWIAITVRSCRAEGTQFEIGVQFQQTPNWNLLLQFG